MAESRSECRCKCRPGVGIVPSWCNSDALPDGRPSIRYYTPDLHAASARWRQILQRLHLDRCG